MAEMKIYHKNNKIGEIREFNKKFYPIFKLLKYETYTYNSAKEALESFYNKALIEGYTKEELEVK